MGLIPLTPLLRGELLRRLLFCFMLVTLISEAIVLYPNAFTKKFVVPNPQKGSQIVGVKSVKLEVLSSFFQLITQDL